MVKDNLKNFMRQLAKFYSIHKIGQPNTDRSLFFTLGQKPNIPIATNTSKFDELQTHIKPYNSYVVGLLNIPRPEHPFTKPSERYCLMYFPNLSLAELGRNISLQLLDRSSGKVAPLSVDTAFCASLIELFREVEVEDEIYEDAFDYDIVINSCRFDIRGELDIEEEPDQTMDQRALATFTIRLK